MTEFDPQPNQEIVTGSDVSLKSLSEHDAPALYQIAKANQSDLEKAEIYVPHDEEDAVSKVTWPMPEGRLDFGIWAEDKIVGEIDFIPQGPHRAEVIYWIDKDHQGNGYAAQAVTALADHSFSNLNVETLRAWVASENKPSQRTLEKVGFIHVDTNTKTGSLGYELRKNESSQSTAG